MLLIALLGALGPLGACGERENAGPDPAAAPAEPTHFDTSTWTGSLGPQNGRVDLSSPATVHGRAVFGGEGPPPRPFDMGKDPWCAEHGVARDESLVVDEAGGLRDVLFHLDGLDEHAAAFPASAEAARLVMRGCRFVPHVLAVRVGQEIAFANEDGTTHHVHFRKADPSTSKTQNLHTSDRFALERPEFDRRIRCDVHFWESCVVHALAHPCFAISAEDGGFEMTGVPPGRYRLRTRHPQPHVAAIADRVIEIGPGERRDVGEVLRFFWSSSEDARGAAEKGPSRPEHPRLGPPTASATRHRPTALEITTVRHRDAVVLRLVPERLPSREKPGRGRTPVPGPPNEDLRCPRSPAVRSRPGF